MHEGGAVLQLDKYQIVYPNCPYPEQVQNLNSQLSSAISASILLIEQDHNSPIHRNHENTSSGSVGKIGANIALFLFFFCFVFCHNTLHKLTVRNLALFGIGAVYPNHCLHPF